MSEQETGHPAELASKAAQARSQSRMLRAETLKVARQVADTEQAVARTLAQLALQHPAHAGRLWAKSEEAEAQAARERQWHDRHSAAPMTGDDGAG